jgi:hypothetical protein
MDFFWFKIVMDHYFVLDSLVAGLMTMLKNRSCLALEMAYMRGFEIFFPLRCLSLYSRPFLGHPQLGMCV